MCRGCLPHGRVDRSWLQRIGSHEFHVRTGFHACAVSTHPNDLVAVGSEEWDKLSTKYAGGPGDEHSHCAPCTLIVIDGDSVGVSVVVELTVSLAAATRAAVHNSAASKINASATWIPWAMRAHAGR
jgi:hypothetical protein